MRILVKDSNDNILVLTSVNGFIPEGYTVVPQEELEQEELSLSKKNKLEEIRSKRNSLLVENDKQWLIKSKKGQSTTALEAEAQALRDLPEEAETALNAMTTLEDIAAYDPFEE